MGTPAFSVPALEALVTAGHEVVGVYTQPPRRAGRGKALRPGAVHRRAEALGLSVRHPVSLKDAQAQAEFAALGAEVAVVVAYGLILSRAILAAPARGCLNIHASLLPRWRGAAPIQRAVLAGDNQTGVCVMQMDEGLDTGAVLQRRVIPIGVQQTSGDLHDRLAALGAGLIVEVLERPDAWQPEAQTADGVRYAHKIEKSEARVDWSRPAVEVDRQIRALSPFPGAWCLSAGERLKLLRSRVVDGGGAPGQVLGGFSVACGSGAVEIVRAQRAGGKPLAAAEFLRGISLAARLD